MQSSFLVFFRPGNCDLQRAETSLLKQGLTVTMRGDHIVAGRPACPHFLISLSSEPHVVIEAIEIGEGTEHSEGMSKCSVRFEVTIDDLDDALDEINTLMEVEVALQEASDGYIFLSWNGTLSASLAGGDAA